MKGNTRTHNSIKNYRMTVISQITSILLSFIGRTFFIKLLSIEYLGVNGLFSNILSLLSLAELGVGTAITYMMYKPIAENDREKVAAYNQLFKKIYNWIGIFILITGLSLTPIIYKLIKEPPQISENLYIIYILFVVNVAISYFYTYKRSLLIAHQKEYVNNQNIIIFAIIKDVVLIVLLYAFKSYYIYLVAQIVITFMSNLVISRKTDKIFPEITKMSPQKVPASEIRIIVKNTMAMVCHKIGSVIVSGTANIFISYFVGLAIVGVYSNYVMMSTAALQIVGKGVNSLTASFGNLVATSSQSNIFLVFKKIYFINFVLSLCIAVYFYALADPFISMWIGSEYLLGRKSLLIITINTLFFYQMRVPSQMVINTYGLFWQIKWKSLFEAAINFGCSFLFAAYFKWGIFGILLSALVSNVTTSLWWEPYIAFRMGLKERFIIYCRMFLKSTVVFVCIILSFKMINNIMGSLNVGIVIEFALNFVIVSILISLFVILFYGKSAEFKYLLSFVKIHDNQDNKIV